ncbi:MAG: VWA domain-containing protein [Blastocatellia bacterium]|nr:VWA domain-containing protein [Blastocatellia bacterium]
MKYKLRIGLVMVLLGTILSTNFGLGTSTLAQSGNNRTAPSQKKNSDLPEPSTEKNKPTTGPQDPTEPQSGGSLSSKDGKRRPPLKKTQKPDDDPGGDPIRIETNVVNLEVVVYNKKTGAIYQNLKKDNFIVFEDGVKQEVTNFSPVEAPITLVMILEYSRVITPFRIEVVRAADAFVRNFVQPKDFISIVAYDIRPKMLNDFTSDINELNSSINILVRGYPAFTESNLFDTLKFVIKGGKVDGEEFVGLNEISGRTAILLVSVGVDTFSKINYDECRKIVENAGIPIYCIGIGNFFYKANDTRLSPEQNMAFLQAFNTLRFFSDSTGGKYFPVTFPGELPTNMKSINALMRNQYSVGYSSTNGSRQGKRRKIELQVDINGDGKPDNNDLVLQYRKSYVEPNDKKK